MSDKSIYIPNSGDKYIKLSQALEALDSCSCWYAHNRMEMIPAADVVERKYGKWNWIGFNIECSECGAMPNFDSTEPLYNFCPNCGAKMDAERGEE